MFLLSAKMSFNIKKMDNELFPKRFIDTYFVNQNQKLQYNIVFMVLYQLSYVINNIYILFKAKN